MHCDLDLWVVISGHDTPLGHGQHLCEILFRSNLAVRSDVLDTDFQYVCIVTLTYKICPWVKVMTHPWVMDNNCVEYYRIQLGSEESWPGHGYWVCVHCDLDLRDDLGSRS